MKTVVIARFAPIPARKPAATKGKEVLKGTKPQPVVIDKAADLLSEDHPAHAAFVAWLKDKPATKRKARVFCKIMGVQRAA